MKILGVSIGNDLSVTACALDVTSRCVDVLADSLLLTANTSSGW